MEQLTELQDPLLLVLVGAAITLIGVLINNLVQVWLANRQSRSSTVSVFRTYADPLAMAATNLLWRLDEVFNTEGRGVFLKGQHVLSTYGSYKQVSSLYRLACLLGWMRAFRRERAFLRLVGRRRLPDLDDALNSFESALADGPHVETERMTELAKLWRIELPMDDAQLQGVGTEIELEIKTSYANLKVENASEMSETEQLSLCNMAAKKLAQLAGSQPPSDGVIRETRERAVRCIAIRQAWLYRDWQSAIGDLMIQEVSGAERRFDIIGFGVFEWMYQAGDERERQWLDRLANIIDDLDVTRTDMFDARIQQLRNTLISTARIVLALSNVKSYHSAIPESTLEKARSIVPT